MKVKKVVIIPILNRIGKELTVMYCNYNVLGNYCVLITLKFMFP